MKKQHILLSFLAPLAILLCLSFTACGEETTEETPTYTEEQPTNEETSTDTDVNEASQEKEASFANQELDILIQRLKWMDGNWITYNEKQKSDPQNSAYEEWKAPKQGLKFGFAYELKDGMTQNGQDKSISIVGETLVFALGKEGQPGYATYPMKEADSDFIIFENLENPFPQTIKYSGEKSGMLKYFQSGKNAETGADLSIETQFILGSTK